MSSQEIRKDIERNVYGAIEAIKNLREAFFGKRCHETYIAMAILATCFGAIFLGVSYGELNRIECKNGTYHVQKGGQQ